MNKMTDSIVVNAPCERVFELIEDESKAALWMEGVEQMIFHEDEKYVGAQFVQHVREGRHLHAYTGELTEYDPPHRFSARVGNEAFQVDVRYELEPVENGCRVTYSSTMVEANWLIGLMAALFNVFTKRLLRRHLANLKRLAETDDLAVNAAWG